MMNVDFGIRRNNPINSKAVYTPPLRERIRVAWQNWRVRHVGKARKTLAKAFRDDPDFRRVWHANISMVIFDNTRNLARGRAATANDLADKLMKHLFEA